VSPVELLDLQAKVLAGEPLTPKELAALETAADQSLGHAVRLTYAHALLNSDQDRAALQVLVRLARGFPSVRAIRLAQARALVGLERYREARPLLEAALREVPEDPEVLKALVVLDLREGAVDRARRRLAEALERDPLDEEAKALRAELDGAEPAFAPSSPSAISRGELTRTLLRVLARRRIRARRDGDGLWIAHQGRSARVSLEAVEDEFARRAVPLPAFAEEIAERLTGQALGLPPTRAELLAQVRPLLRRCELRGEAPQALWRAGPANLCWFYALEDERWSRLLPAASLDGYGVDPEEFHQAALAALESEPSPLEPLQARQARALGVPASARILVRADGRDLARLVTATQRSLIEQALGTGPWWVWWLPDERVALAAGELLEAPLGLTAGGELRRAVEIASD
jgi:hypothetical protein